MTTEPAKITESVVEQTALAWFESLGYAVESGPAISPGEPGAERGDYDQVVLLGRLQTALSNINPNIPPDAIGEAVRKITRTESPSLIENNRRFHRMLTDGIPVSYRREPSPQPSPKRRGISIAVGSISVGWQSAHENFETSKHPRNLLCGSCCVIGNFWD